MAHRSYTRFRPDPEAPEAVSFDLDGEHFACVPKLPAGAVFDLGGLGSSTVRTIEFIQGCLQTEKDAERFMVEMRRRDLITDPQLLRELLADLMVDYGYSRPTTPPEESRPGASSTPGSSSGGADSQGSTPTP